MSEYLAETLHWTEYFRAIGPTLIAAIVMYVAIEQWRISRANFAEKLFDRRYILISAARSLVTSTLYSSKDEILESRNEMARLMFEASYLFDERTAEAVDQLFLESLKITRLERRGDHLSKTAQDDVWETNNAEIQKAQESIGTLFRKIEAETAPLMDLSRYQRSAAQMFLLALAKFMGVARQ